VKKIEDTVHHAV